VRRGDWGLNALDRFKAQWEGRAPDRPANFDIFMTFAAHLIGKPLRQYYTDFRTLCEANYAILQKFDVDIVQAISDPYREAHDFGAAIEFPHDGLPVCMQPLLQSERDLLRMKRPDPTKSPRMLDRLRAVEAFRATVGGEIPIMGWVEGALAEAADLRGVQTLLTDLMERPSWVHDLLERCTDVAIAFAVSQMEAGADIIGLGDAVASQVSPKMYEEFALPYEKRIFDAVRKAGGVARLHICGDITHLLSLVPKAHPHIVDLDWMVSIPEAIKILPTDILICGNVDPVAVMLDGTPDHVYEETMQCIRQGVGRLIAGAGCEIPDGTPHENLKAQARAIRESCSLKPAS
jgi:MtaA/CmuA family methyltransferase